MKGLLLFLLGTQSAFGGTVLMPAFYPESEADRAHADRFHDELLIELLATGHTAIGQDALRSRVGSIVDTCALTSDCPQRLFRAWPAPVAVVGEVYADGDDMGVVVSIYVPGSPAPVRVFDQTVEAGTDWTGVENLLEEIGTQMPEGDTEEGALSLLDGDFDDVRAVQAEGLAEEAAEAGVVERLGYVDEEEPMADEEILSLLGIGDPQTASSEATFEIESEPVTEIEEEPAAPAVVDLDESTEVAEDAVEVAEPEIEPAPLATVDELYEEEEEEGIPDDGAEETRAGTEEETREASGDEEPLPEPSTVSEQDEPSVYESDVLPILPEIQVVDSIDVPEPPPRSTRPAGVETVVLDESESGTVEDRKSLNLDPVLYGALERSGLDSEQWLKKWRPHVNNAHIEVFGGVPYGDTVRSYDVRLTLDADTLDPIGSAQRDIFVEGIGYEFGASFGFTPIPWLDFSALFSVTGGVKELTTGWATVDGVLVADSSLMEHTPAQSWQAVVEPRVRLYLLPVSWMKLYGLGGITVRFSDSFEAPDLNTVVFPDRPSWTNVGWMVGGGLMFDPHDRIGIFVETPWVHWFSPGDSYSAQEGTLPPILAQPVERTGWVLRGNAGIQFRL